MAGAPKFEPSQSLPEVSYADLATTMGWNAITVREDDAVARKSRRYLRMWTTSK
ncbi:thiamine pyrophosphate-dependent enzyme, possible carboligase or decarboxylase [Mycobacteroides abscessus subsp. massiliense]|nr:thiamine pyrophosphate-dependent enzyme, possible carboligase or decarboxylase [Mycobacteroides abscessus subsp. massiliense]